jgi:hypothetical protein
MSSPKSVVGDPEPKSMDSRQQSAGMTKRGSLVLSWIEGLLLCIKTKKVKKLSYGSPIETFEDHGLYIFATFISFCIFVHEISNIYSDDDQRDSLVKYQTPRKYASDILSLLQSLKSNAGR